MSLKKAKINDLDKICDICTQFGDTNQIYATNDLRGLLAKHINEETVIYDRGIIIVYTYFGTIQRLPFDYKTFPQDILILYVINENPGNGLMDIVMDEFLASIDASVYSISLNDNKWITNRLVRRGYKKLYEGKMKIHGKFKDFCVWKEK